MKRFNLLVPLKMYNSVKEIARDKGCSKSFIIRSFISLGVEIARGTYNVHTKDGDRVTILG